jgi:hypothetical protein
MKYDIAVASQIMYDGTLDQIREYINPKKRINHLYPIEIAAMHGQIDVALILIDKGSGVYYAMVWACAWGNLEFMQLLYERGASVDVKNKFLLTPLHVIDDNVPITQWLLARTANVNALNKKGESPLLKLLNDMHALCIFRDAYTTSKMQTMAQIVGMFLAHPHICTDIVDLDGNSIEFLLHFFSDILSVYT